MLWGKKKTEDEKERQLKQLKNAFPSIRRPQNDDTLFEIRFMVENQSFALRIFIPSDFPSMRPVLQVAGSIEHPWLDQFKQVNGCHKLMNWSKSSVLVEVVEETLAALSTGGVLSSSAAAAGNTTSRLSLSGTSDNRASLSYGAGVPNAFTSPGTPAAVYGAGGAYGLGGSPRGIPPAAATAALPSPTAQAGHRPTGADNSSTSSPSLTHPGKLSSLPPPKPTRPGRDALSPIAMPELPTSFPELQSMTDLQLQRLLHDEVALTSHVEHHVHSIDLLRSMVVDLQRSNADAASANVLMSEELQLLREKATATQQLLRTVVGEYNGELDTLVHSVSSQPEAILQEVNVQRQALDEASEEIGRKLVAGGMDMAVFMKDYIEARTKFHVLSTKAQIVRIV